MEKIDNANILEVLRMLTVFEEDMAEYYHSLAGICKNLTEFWQSASLLKTTRANLYSNLMQDFTINVNDYDLVRGINGPFLNLLNKIKTQKKRVTPELMSPRENDHFIEEVECTSGQQSVLPVVQGTTQAYAKIKIILEKTQARQAQLISAYLKTTSRCNG